MEPFERFDHGVLQVNRTNGSVYMVQPEWMAQRIETAEDKVFLEPFTATLSMTISSLKLTMPAVYFQ